MADAATKRTIIAEARIQEAAHRAVATAFEELTFMETEAVAELPGLETGQVYAHIEADAPLPASFTLQMSTGLVDACIDALYAGIDPTEAVRQDLVRELINTIAGLVMSNLTEDELIRLGLPDSGQDEPAMREPKRYRHRVDLNSVALTVNWD